jgi:hypothetical protein
VIFRGLWGVGMGFGAEGNYSRNGQEPYVSAAGCSCKFGGDGGY